jgi:hypothetical protein
MLSVLAWPPRGNQGAAAGPPAFPRGLLCVDAATGAVRDVLRMMGEIMCEHFSAQTLLLMSDYELSNDPGLAGPNATPEEQAEAKMRAQQKIAEAIMMLKNEKIRAFRIDIEDESTIAQDDQAETVLMRLARRAGVDGLSAMSGRRRAQGMIWLRPLLSVSRDELRACLRARGQDWIEDPSNDALRFDRVKARRALAHLAPLGITPAVLAGVADQMRLARTALEQQTEAAARQIARIEGGDVVMDRTGFQDLPAEIRRRLLVGALGWVGSADYGPRAASVQARLAAVAADSVGKSWMSRLAS